MPLDAVGAERAFVGADARVRSIRRQVLVAIFAIRPQFERHFRYPKKRQGLPTVDQVSAQRNLTQAWLGQDSRPPLAAAKLRRPVRRISRRRRSRLFHGQPRRQASSRRPDLERQPLEDEALAHLRLRVQKPPPRRVGQMATPSFSSSMSRPRSRPATAPVSNVAGKPRRPFARPFPVIRPASTRWIKPSRASGSMAAAIAGGERGSATCRTGR